MHVGGLNVSNMHYVWDYEMSCLNNSLKTCWVSICSIKWDNAVHIIRIWFLQWTNYKCEFVLDLSWSWVCVWDWERVISGHFVIIEKEKVKVVWYVCVKRYNMGINCPKPNTTREHRRLLIKETKKLQVLPRRESLHALLYSRNNSYSVFR